MAAHDPVQHGVSLALEAHRRKLLDDRCLDAILQYYDAEGARDPFPAAEVLVRIGGLSEEALRSLFAGPAPSPSDVQGEKFGDRLTLLDQVGEGGMGTVFRAYDKVLKRGVAVKRLRIDHLDGKGAAKVLARFEREAHAMARVRHPACVQIFDAGLTPKGEPYLVMEFVAGKSLRALIEESYEPDAPRDSDPLLAPVVPPPARPPRPLDPQLVARLGASLAEALQACHDVGLIHRDVKPANVLLDAQGTPRLTDFGVALDDHARTKLTVDRAMVGTLAYMAPEQALGERVDARCDVYALGVTLYEALAGEPPHDAGAALVLLRQVLSDEPAALHTHRRDVPRDLETIIHKCLAKAAGDRYATAQALALDLRRFLADEPVLAQPVSGVQRLARRAWRARRWVGGGVVVAVGGMIALGVARVHARENARAEIESALAAAAIASDLDAAEARVLPLIAVAEPDQAEQGREALRLLRGRRRLREAEAAFARWRDGVAMERALRLEATALREKIDVTQEFKTSPDKQRLISLQAEGEEIRTKALSAFLETERLVAQAAADAADGVDALRVRILVERARDVEDRTPGVAEGLFREADAIVGASSGRFDVDLSPPVVIVECDPPARVTLCRYRFTPTEGLMVPTEGDRAESTPATLRGDEVGEYLLEVTAPGYLGVRDLLRLSRGSRRTVKLSLVGEASLGPLAGLVVHIPAGEARWQVDLERREALGEFLLMRDEVSYPQWNSFVIARTDLEGKLAAFLPADAAGQSLVSKAQLHSWPVVSVTWREVQQYVRWFQAEIDLAGLEWTVELPSNSKFARALRGELFWAFPWGNVEEPTFCITLDGAPMEYADSARVLRLLRPTQDVSGFGVRRLAGLVAEFISPNDPNEALVIGGSYSTPIWLSELLLRRGMPQSSSAEIHSVGFRLEFVRRMRPPQMESDPGVAQTLKDDALRSLQRSDPVGALGLLTRALHSNGNDFLVWNLRGNVRRMLKDHWGALWDYSVALAKRPKNARTLVNRGLTHLECGATSEALDDLNAAVEIETGLVDGWAARSMAKLEAGDLEGARRDAQEARRRGPNHPIAAEALRRVEQGRAANR